MFENMENYIFKMFFQISVLLLFYTQLNIGLEGPNVCHGNNRKKQCCYNYEEKDGKCQICKNGTISKQGQKCLPCLENKYGYKCLERCSCSKFERCDTENGCVVDLLSTEKFSTERNLDTYHTMRDESTTRYVDQVKSVLHHEMFIYSVCVTLIIVVIGINFIVFKCKRKRTQRVVITNRAAIQHVNITTNQEYIYDEIDESGIIDIEAENKNRDSRSIMPDYFDFSNADPSISSTESSDDYLNPCHSSNDISRNDYQSDAESVEICVDASGYLSSYQRLQDNWMECSNKYELIVSSNTLESYVSVAKQESDTNVNAHSSSLSDDAPNKTSLPAIAVDINNEIVQSAITISEINQSETQSISSSKEKFGYELSEHVSNFDTDITIHDYEDNTPNDYVDANSC